MCFCSSCTVYEGPCNTCITAAGAESCTIDAGDRAWRIMAGAIGGSIPELSMLTTGYDAVVLGTL